MIFTTRSASNPPIHRPHSLRILSLFIFQSSLFRNGKRSERQLNLSMEQDIFETIKKYGQEHLIDHYETLADPALKAAFLAQLQSVDYQQASQLYQHVYVEREQLKNAQNADFAPVSNIATHEDLKLSAGEFDQIGFEAIGRGEVAVCIMSGGQGTRLGFDHPKGMYNLGLESGLTLFGYFANRLLRLNEIVKEKLNIKTEGCLVKWYLMTSDMNHNEIVSYFKEHNFFGYEEKSIVFFPQGGIPALFYNGKIIVESQGNLSLAPGGNGAIYTEMRNKKVLDHMKENGVKYIYLGPVDNVLLKLADPTSLGYLVKNNFDIVSHYLKKRSADQKVGLHLSVDGKIKILEYSETNEAVKETRNEKGEFVFSHGSRASMYITREFIEKLTNDPATMLNINKKYHLAEKKVKHLDANTNSSVTPTANNGVKFELFYFDVFEETNQIGLFETLRDEEFAPLKNAKGDDSPDTAREYLKNLHRRWVEAAGVKLQGEGKVEIHPRRSYNGEGIREYILAKNGSLTATLPLYIS